jgi:hypothetical protein
LHQQHQLTIRTSAQAAKTLETLQNSTAGASGKVKLRIRVKSLKMGYQLFIFCKYLEKVFKTLNISVKIRLKKSQRSLFLNPADFIRSYSYQDCPPLEKKIE